MKTKNNIILSVAAFLLPALVLLCVLAIEGFAPFGDKSLLIMDMSDQYIEFLNGLKFGDIWFSWSKSLGTNYIGVFAYYVSSPFNFITFFFPNKYMPYCVMLLTELKLGCAGMTSRLYFEKRYSVHGLGSLIFSTAYSLMAYNLAYSMCIMWLDGVIWLPVVLLGIEYILSDRNGRLFRISLLLSLISNYYISYMIVLFSALYFVIRCVEENFSAKQFFQKGFTFAGNGIISAGLGAFFLIPTFLSHFEGKLVSAQADYSSVTNFHFPEFITKLLFGGYDSITNSGRPFVYCGILIVWFALSFFVHERISLRSKLCYGAMLTILVLSMWLSPLDKVWHVFKYPNWFPYRYAFLFSFALIATACRAYSAKSTRKQSVVILLLLIMIANLGWSGITIFRGLDEQFHYDSLSEYITFQNEKAELLSHIPEESSFYRVRSSEDRSKNDAIGFHYNGTTHYSSSYLATVNQWVKSFGMGQSWFWCSDYGSTPVTDLFLNIKYVISKESPGPCYTLIAENSLGGLYRFNYSGSLGYLALYDWSTWSKSDNPFENQNHLFRLLSGNEDIVFCSPDSEAYTDNNITTITLISNGNPLYCNFKLQNTPSALYVNNEFRTFLSSGETDCIQYLGTFPFGEEIEIRVESYVEQYSLYYLDMDIFNLGAENANSYCLTQTTTKSYGEISGQISCNEDAYILTSVPASEGWDVRVDGKVEKLGIGYDTFILIPISAGEHRISMQYILPGLWTGIIVSIITILGLAVFECFIKFRSRETS